MSEQATPGLGHNKPPVTPPTEADLLDDLRVRYPEVEPKLKELTDAAAQAPKVIESDEDAGKVQDLYRTIKKYTSTWKAWRGVEKGPWDKLAKTALNFFKDPEDKLDAVATELRERHTAFTEKKAEAARLDAARVAEEQRKEAERLRAEADAAEQRRKEAERLQKEAEEREAKALAEEAAAKERRRLADEAAERARAEEKRLEAERKERERAEKEQNAESIRSAKKLMKEADSLFGAFADAEDAEVNPRLEEIVGAGGELAMTLSPLLQSHLLDDDQKASIDLIRGGVLQMRKSVADRLDAKERKKRAAAEKKRAAEEAEAAEVRRKAREADEARAAEARRQREEAEAEATRAKQEAKDARKDVRSAQAEQDDAADEAKAAEREGRQIGGQADKVERRADRLDNKLATSSDADMSRTRGGYSVGSLSGRWDWRIKDRDALVATLGVMGPYIHPDAIEAGLTKYMRQHQGDWADKRRDGVVEGMLPGVVFDWVSDSRIV